MTAECRRRELSEPLDILLGEEHVLHYMSFIRSGDGKIYVAPVTEAPWRFRASSAWENVAEEGAERHGPGPAQCSSSFALAVQPGWSWDVCGYYRRLGADFTATRLQLRHAYTARGGPDDARLTYALSQLLNPLVRRAYDRATPDEPFLLDRDTQEALKRAALRMVSERRAQSMEDALSAQGIRFTPAAPEAAADEPPGGRGFSLPAHGEDQEPSGAQPLGATLTSWAAQWSWYTRRGVYPSQRDLLDLEEWQRRLRGALAYHGVTASFAVGFYDGDSWEIWGEPSAGTCIVFLGYHAAASAALVPAAIREFIRLLRMSPSPSSRSGDMNANQEWFRRR